jgi:hypothetical protein
MNDIAVLWYADSRHLARGVHSVLKSPLRAIGWIALLLYFGFNAYLQSRRVALHGIFPPLSDPVATGIAGAAVSLAGLLLWNAAKTGRIGNVSEPVEALFLSRSAIGQPLVAAWLYGRHFLLTYARVISGAILFCIGARSSQATTVLALAGLMLAIEMSRVPAATLSRRIPVLAPFFLILSAFGLVLIAADATALISPDLSSAQTWAVQLGFGRGLMALWNGTPLALAIVYVTAVASIVAGCAFAGDLYPEIYASSAFFSKLRLRQRRNLWSAESLTSRGPTRSGSTRLSGPWVEIWKQLAFLRRSSSRSIVTMALLLSIAIGFVAGVGGLHHRGFGLSTLIAFALLIMLALNVLSVSLARDLSKPLWWMGDGSVFLKLTAWAIGSSLLPIVMLMSAAITANFFTSRLAMPLLICGAILFPPAMRGIGALGYALLPNQSDQRGPGMALRMLIAYAAIIAACALGLLAGFATRSAWFGGLVAIIVFSVLGIAALALAAWRISGRGVEYALAE